MKLAIAQAFNGEHKNYKKSAKDLKINAFLFDIDTANWLNNLKQADAYLWHADAKDENYRIIHDRIYFIENILKKKVFPDMNMYFAYNDKIKQNDIFKFYDISTPKTYITYNKDTALSIADKIKYPFVVKNAHGYGGYHVYKIENKKKAKEMIDKIFSSRGFTKNNIPIKNYFLAQEFLQIEKDLRVIIIGNKVACAYWREIKKDWKANIEQGAEPNFENIPKKALNLALSFHKKMKFHWMAYDIFVLKNGEVKIVEFACNFGVKAPSDEGYDVRKMQVEYIKRTLKK